LKYNAKKLTLDLLNVGSMINNIINHDVGIAFAL